MGERGREAEVGEAGSEGEVVGEKDTHTPAVTHRIETEFNNDLETARRSGREAAGEGRKAGGRGVRCTASPS